MTEFQKAMEQMVVDRLSQLSDSQFLGFIAMSMQDNGGVMSDYAARRIDMIALRIQAEEAGGEP